MELKAVEDLIRQGFSDAEVQVSGDGCNLEATVISPEFSGMTRIKQHRRVQDSVKHLITSGELHALSINTYTPEAWAAKQG
jgi:acid stress-induced BolA-like protein IbaG/YrbA